MSDTIAAIDLRQQAQPILVGPKPFQWVQLDIQLRHQLPPRDWPRVDPQRRIGCDADATGVP